MRHNAEKTRSSASARPPARDGLKRAFTLVELLTVISIIALLLTILLPSVKSVLNTAAKQKTMARVHSLDQACRAYRRELQWGYPGQRYLNVSDGSFAPPTDRGFTQDQGSQWLTAGLFPPWGRYGVLPGSNSDPNWHAHKGVYITFAPDMVDCNARYSYTKIDCALDAYPSPMPILYYVARPDQVGVSQYCDVQNSALTNPKSVAGTGITDANHNGAFDVRQITDYRRPSSPGIAQPPYNPGEFIMVAAGIVDPNYITTGNLDPNRVTYRKYFQPSGDIKSFNLGG